jgi:hypothetical protein
LLIETVLFVRRRQRVEKMLKIKVADQAIDLKFRQGRLANVADIEKDARFFNELLRLLNCVSLPYDINSALFRGM